jgi:hypothetical protein
MRSLTLDNVTSVVEHSFEQCENERLWELLTVLARYLLGYAKEVHLEPDEWCYAYGLSLPVRPSLVRFAL